MRRSRSRGARVGSSNPDGRYPVASMQPVSRRTTRPLDCAHIAPGLPRGAAGRRDRHFRPLRPALVPRWSLCPLSADLYASNPLLGRILNFLPRTKSWPVPGAPIRPCSQGGAVVVGQQPLPLRGFSVCFRMAKDVPVSTQGNRSFGVARRGVPGVWRAIRRPAGVLTVVRGLRGAGLPRCFHLQLGW